VIWIIGEQSNPSGRRTDQDTQARLAHLLDVPRDEMMDAVIWLNLFEYEGTRPERYVRLIEESAAPGDAILLLGRRVQRAFGLEEARELSIVVRSGGVGPTIVVVPHPSGLNRWWNDPDHVDDAAIVLRRIWGGHVR
jgi:hypothetical protein